MSEERLKLAVDAALPIAAWADDIVAAVRDNQVVIVAGETGSGKTTQLPKLCLAAGRERVGHTQPRRIAARSLAERIAEEIGTPLGDVVGYQVRFTAKTSRQTKVKVMTDGILLAEIGHDRDLRRYDTLIIDEAHERSLNIDFLLGYLKQLLPRRPDLKVIVTSATIDTARFSEHFGDAPIIEVSGRTYPVEVRWRPVIEQGTDRDLIDGICDAVTELMLDGPDGDILVFCSGEREIRDTADAIAGLDWPQLTRREVEILPLFARLSAHEQHRVFARHTTMRVVLATNVAETSLTVPGIRSVIDPGFARISRWSARTKVQRLPIEPISQASANQRAGRCGRVAPGVCIRLYDEEDFTARPEFTEPEILRTNLASVILQMAQARLGDIARFPFVEPPDAAQISDGLRLLSELGAIESDRGESRGLSSSKPGEVSTGSTSSDGASSGGGSEVSTSSTSGGAGVSTDGRGVSTSGGGGGGRRRNARGRGGQVRLTPVGHQLARLPVDPRLGRMLVEAERQGCLREAQAVVAGLTVPDVRERPADKQEQADQLHRRFFSESPEEGKDAPRDPSDIAALLRLWRYLRRSRRERSGNAFRRMCREEYLNFLRVREWEDLNEQLKTVCRDLGMSRNSEPAGVDRVHLAVLSGLLSHVGLLDERSAPKPGDKRPADKRRRGPREYLGARGSRFAISPGSAAARINPPLVMAVELVETTRLWARTVAPIEEAWVEEVGGHLLSRTYSEPRWSARSGQVVATERVTLLGVPIVAGRTVSYGRIDPEESRRLFIQSALVEGQWRTRHHFWARNEAVRSDAEQLAERTRRLDLLADDAALYAFYDARIPADVVSVGHFDRWWRDARRRDDHLLDLAPGDLLTDDRVDAEQFPDHWTSGELDLPVSYVFDPGSGHDGVTVEIELAQLNQVAADDFGWQIPGLRQELATELIRTLPKHWRARLVPAPDTAKRALGWLAEHPQSGEPLPAGLGRAVRTLTGVQVPDDAWRIDAVPDHLRVRFVVTRDGDQVATGKDLPALAEQLGGQVRAELNAGAAEHTHAGAKQWDFGTVAEQVEGAVVGYPALSDQGDAVGVTVYATPDEAIRSQLRGLRRLVVLTSPDPTNWVVARLSNPVKFALAASPYPSVPALLADSRLAAAGALIGPSRRLSLSKPEVQALDPADPWLIRDGAAFAALRDRVRSGTADRMLAIVTTAGEVLQRYQRIQLALPSAPADTRADVTEQLAGLIHPGFIAATSEPHWSRLPRYLRAIELRLTGARSNPGRERAGAQVIDELEDDYAALCARYPAGPLPDAVAEIGWLLEELRVSLFAQTLGTAAPVSAKRVRTAMAGVPEPTTLTR